MIPGKVYHEEKAMVVFLEGASETCDQGRTEAS